ncbi:5-oxoproline transporter, DUF969 family subunit [Novosphingobium pokkalii]|uniref:5-oxoproline transporter, DUF969 family subunit n=1 Tax=Novosphingobium pokkalii TaxID=1770194 RepID=A0ABV7V860_9SPHN|nr:DUF969 family protein [Novosphingobium pokkalii]GHC96653.1 membrane protein [Novosphingobium pokkalii]
MLVLSGIVIIVAGFAMRVHPLLVVTVAAFASAAAAGMAPLAVVALIGKAFVDARFLAVAWLALPAIGLLERAGLREQARAMVQRLRGATAGRVLLGYFVLRQAAAALGLTALGGHVPMVRPIVAPMVEGAAERDAEAPLDEDERQRLRAHAAAVDNIALFFGEDVFIAVGSILLIRAILQQEGVTIAPLSVALWAIPTALAALLIHGLRLLRLDRKAAR